MRSRIAAFPVRKRATCCTALEMADGHPWALIYSFGVSILAQTTRIPTRSMCRAAHVAADAMTSGLPVISELSSGCFQVKSAPQF
jgi:hypothetical protein